MADINSFRVASREAKTQVRMKKRAEDWWHMNQCPNCQAKLAMMRQLQDAVATDQTPLPTIGAARTAH